MSFKYIFQKYIKNPSTCGELLIEENEDVLLIKDGFPKASLHWLIIPRDATKTKENPLTVFQDTQFKKLIENHLEVYKQDMIIELDKIFYGGGQDPDNLKFIESFIKVGVHAVPSLSNLHIHLISKDMNSASMKRKVHYNSFTTDFFVDFEDLPLEEGDHRLDKNRMESLVNSSDMKCIYCEANFQNKFVKLKEHLRFELTKTFRKRK